MDVATTTILAVIAMHFIGFSCCLSNLVIESHKLRNAILVVSIIMVVTICSLTVKMLLNAS